MTNPIQELERAIHDRAPELSTRYEPPLLPTGIHDLAIRLTGRLIVIRWRAATGFRIYEVRDDDEDGFFDAVPSVGASSVGEAMTVIAGLLAPEASTASAG